MKVLTLCLIFLIITTLSCSKPKATVFKDERLAQQENVKFCFLGDLGKESEHQEKMTKALSREDCDRIFFLGDLVYPAGIDSISDPNLQTKFLDYYQPLLDEDPGLIIPLVLGNHDHKGDPAAWKKLAKQNPGFFFPNYYYMIDYGGLCVVALDTSFYYYTEKVSEAAEQSLWLTNLQSRLKDCDVKVAITHHPLKGDKLPGSKDWNGASGPLKAFLETYIIGKVDIHISGHVHILHNDGTDEGTKLFISGTGGENLGDERAGYIILRWEPQNPKRIGYRFRYVDTDVNVVEDPLETRRQEQQESQDESDYVIDKRWVEPPFYYKLLDRLKNLLD